METMTAQQAAQRWGISDRRVRVLCGEGKVPGAAKDGRSYKIPADAVRFTAPEYNKVVSLYTRGANRWTCPAARRTAWIKTLCFRLFL